MSDFMNPRRGYFHILKTDTILLLCHNSIKLTVCCMLKRLERARLVAKVGWKKSETKMIHHDQ